MLFIAGRQSHDELREAGDVVDLLFDRKAGAQVVEFHGAGGFRQDGEGERIPFGEYLAMGNVFAILNAETRAVNHVVAFLFAAFFVNDGDQTGAVHGDERASAALDGFQVNELDHAVVAGFERGALRNAGCRTSDMERAHGELRARFADGLRGNNANGFAKLDHAAGREVAPIAKRANTATGLAREHRANLHALDTGSLHLVREVFGNLLVDLDNHVALEVLDLVERHAANNAVAERLDFDAGFDDRLDVDAVRGAAIALIDDDVLGHVNETASQVAGVGGLERGIRQAFARAVRRDEVVQHVQAFTEVRGDGRLDDFAGRLGHQSAHARELANLLFRSARAGVR